MHKVSDTKPGIFHKIMVWTEAEGPRYIFGEKYIEAAKICCEYMKTIRFPQHEWPNYKLDESYVPWLFQAVWSDEENCEVWSLVK